MEDYPFHPAADAFHLLEGEELQRMADSIRADGLELPIYLWNGQIIDGRNRYRACKMARVEPRFEDRSDVPEEDLPNLIDLLNFHRRHLTSEQKREIIAARLKKDPEKSDRRVAAEVGADGKTVDSVRTDLEGRAEIPHVEKRKDTKGRSQPATKPKKAETNGKAKAAHAVSVEEREEPAPPADVDGLGLPVPEKLRPVFDAREKYREARSLVRKLEALVDAIARQPGGEHLRLDLSRQGPSEDKTRYRSNSLRDFKYTLKSTEPHSSVCPWCHSEHPGKANPSCKACYGLGWVPLRDWKQAPREEREDVEALVPKEENP